MGKLKDAHIFSNGKGSVVKFFIALISFAIAVLAAGIIFSWYIEEGPFIATLGIMLILILVPIITVIYFMTRLLAYRTKVFPTIKNREGLHGVSFCLLFILSVVLFFVFT